MSETLILLILVSAVLVIWVVVAAIRHRQKVEELRSEIDTLEDHNRKVRNERDDLSSKIDQARSSLEDLRGRHETLGKEKAEIEKDRNHLRENCERLERTRTELETTVGHLRTEKEALEKRVNAFQDDWRRQLSTLEEEISTLLRQIGEFQKATQMPLTSSGETASRASGVSHAEGHRASGVGHQDEKEEKS